MYIIMYIYIYPAYHLYNNIVAIHDSGVFLVNHPLDTCSFLLSFQQSVGRCQGHVHFADARSASVEVSADRSYVHYATVLKL